jgi:hypothetical protein
MISWNYKEAYDKLIETSNLFLNNEEESINMIRQLAKNNNNSNEDIELVIIMHKNIIHSLKIIDSLSDIVIDTCTS